MGEKETNKYICLQELLDKYSCIKKETKKVRQTFMMVSGYPHFENVTSNILAFLFNDTEEHKMNNLWIRAFLDDIPNINICEVTNTIVEREVTTDKGNRIDLVVYSDNYIIGIENKLYSSVYNDLDDYANTIKNIGVSNNLKEINILLSLYDEKDIAQKHNFINITYNKLFSNVRKYIGEYLEEADNTWVTYVKDFIYTIENLIGDGNMDKEFAKFLYDNKNNIDSLLYSVEEYKKEIKRDTENLKGMLDLDSKIQGHSYSVFCYNTKVEAYSCVCIDIKRADDRILTVEVFKDYAGWHITLFDRKGQGRGKKELERKLKEKGIKYTPISGDEQKLEVQTCPYNCETNKVLDKIYLGIDQALQIL